jgi:hypothetical protein
MFNISPSQYLQKGVTLRFFFFCHTMFLTIIFVVFGLFKLIELYRVNPSRFNLRIELHDLFFMRLSWSQKNILMLGWCSIYSNTGLRKKTQTVNHSLLTKSYAIKESMPSLQADNKRCHQRNKKGDEIITTISFYVVYVKALSQFHPYPDLFNLVVMRQINNI